MKIYMLMLGLLLAVVKPSQAESVKEEYDFNFDGRMDYRIRTLENKKASLFDVYIFDTASGKHVKDPTLSGLIYPRPDPKNKHVLSIFTGGHGGALFTGEAYTWNGKGFDFAFSVKQEWIHLSGGNEYVRVKAKMVDGKSVIFSIEAGDPQWDDDGGSIE